MRVTRLNAAPFMPIRKAAAAVIEYIIMYNIIHYMAAVRVRGRRRKRPVRVIFNLRPRIMNAKI